MYFKRILSALAVVAAVVMVGCASEENYEPVKFNQDVCLLEGDSSECDLGEEQQTLYHSAFYSEWDMVISQIEYARQKHVMWANLPRVDAFPSAEAAAEKTEIALTLLAAHNMLAPVMLGNVSSDPVFQFRFERTGGTDVRFFNYYRYAPVIDPRFSSIQDIRDMANSVFADFNSQEIRLFEQSYRNFAPLYLEIDGVLHRLVDISGSWTAFNWYIPMVEYAGFQYAQIVDDETLEAAIALVERNLGVNRYVSEAVLMYNCAFALMERWLADEAAPVREFDGARYRRIPQLARNITNIIPTENLTIIAITEESFVAVIEDTNEHFTDAVIVYFVLTSNGWRIRHWERGNHWWFMQSVNMPAAGSVPYILMQPLAGFVASRYFYDNTTTEQSLTNHIFHIANNFHHYRVSYPVWEIVFMFEEIDHLIDFAFGWLNASAMLTSIEGRGRLIEGYDLYSVSIAQTPWVQMTYLPNHEYSDENTYFFEYRMTSHFDAPEIYGVVAATIGSSDRNPLGFSIRTIHFMD